MRLASQRIRKTNGKAKRNGKQWGKIKRMFRRSQRKRMRRCAQHSHAVERMKELLSTFVHLVYTRWRCPVLALAPNILVVVHPPYAVCRSHSDKRQRIAQTRTQTRTGEKSTQRKLKKRNLFICRANRHIPDTAFLSHCHARLQHCVD